MKRLIQIFCIFLLVSTQMWSQVRPDHFTEEAAPNSENFEVYSQKGGVNRRASLANLRRYFAPNIVTQVYPPPLSGNLEATRNKVVDVTSDGTLWYIDWAGYAVRLNGGSSIVVEGTSADTTEMATPGDIVIDENSLFIRTPGRWVEWRQSFDAVDIPYDPTGLALASEDMQAVVAELLRLIPGQVITTTNTLFVSKSVGIDTLAKVGSILFPFRTPWSARDTAEARGIVSPIIVVLDGAFRFHELNHSTADYNGLGDYFRITLVRDGYTYYSYPGVSYTLMSGDSDVGTAFFSDSTGAECKFLGEADLYMNNRVSWVEKRANLTFRANSLRYFQFSQSAFQIKDPVSEEEAVLDINIKTITIAGSSRYFSFWGTSPFDDTLSANISIRVENLIGEDLDYLFSSDPIYFFQGRILLDIGSLYVEDGNGLFRNMRTGFLDSYFYAKIDQLIITKPTDEPLFLFRWDTSAKPWSNSTVEVVIDNVQGPFQAFHSHSSVVSTNGQLKMKLSGVNTYSGAGSIFNFSPRAGFMYKYAGRLDAVANLFALNVAGGSSIIEDALYKTTQKVMASTVAGIDTLKIVNSYLGGDVDNTFSHPIVIKSAGSYLSPSVEDDANVTTIRMKSIGEVDADLSGLVEESVFEDSLAAVRADIPAEADLSGLVEESVFEDSLAAVRADIPAEADLSGLVEESVFEDSLAAVRADIPAEADLSGLVEESVFEDSLAAVRADIPPATDISNLVEESVFEDSLAAVRADIPMIDDTPLLGYDTLSASVFEINLTAKSTLITNTSATPILVRRLVGTDGTKEVCNTSFTPIVLAAQAVNLLATSDILIGMHQCARLTKIDTFFIVEAPPRSFDRKTVIEFFPQSNSAVAHSYITLGAANSATFSADNATATEPARFALRTGTNSNGLYYLTLGKVAVLTGYFGRSHNSFDADLVVPILSDGTNSFTVLAHLTNTATSTSLARNHSIGFRYSHSINGGNWELYSRITGGDETTLDSGIEVVGGEIYNLRVENDAANSTARYFINGVLVGEIATTMPSSNPCAGSVLIAKTGGTTSREVYVNRATQISIF